jgi:hypothetical protein
MALNKSQGILAGSCGLYVCHGRCPSPTVRRCRQRKCQGIHQTDQGRSRAAAPRDLTVRRCRSSLPPRSSHGKPDPAAAAPAPPTRAAVRAGRQLQVAGSCARDDGSASAPVVSNLIYLSPRPPPRQRQLQPRSNHRSPWRRDER